MSKRPTPERVSEIRHEWMRGKWGIPAQGAGEHVGILIVEIEALATALDAEKARAQTAEDALAKELSARNLSGEVLQRCDAVLNGPPPETHWRSLHDVDVEVAALKARAQTAEDALAMVLRADQPYSLLGLLGYAADALDHLMEVHSCDVHGWEVWDSTRKHIREHLAAITATPTDLAAASRREWRAQGIEDVADMLDRVGEQRSARAAKAMATETRTRAIADALAAKHAKLRGER